MSVVNAFEKYSSLQLL